MKHFKNFTVDDLRIQFNGLQPAKEDSLYFEIKMRELREQAPHNSLMNAVLTAHKNQIRGVLKIYSPSGPFFTATEATNIKDLAKKLVAQMRRKLNRWKSKRFSRESIRTLEKPHEEKSYDKGVA